MRSSLVIAATLSSLLLASAPAMAADDPGFNPLGPFRLGATVGIGFPSPVSGQVVFKFKNIVGANLEFGALPQLTFSPAAQDIHISQQMFDASLRVYPFHGDFFLGLGVGKQWITVSTTVVQQGRPTGETLKTDSTFLSPRLGILHRFPFGLALGMDVGVELPVAGNTDIQASVAVPKEASDAANLVRTTPIPIIHLLQLGYIF
jgi:hypothetical protein